MDQTEISVIISTRDRREILEETLTRLFRSEQDRIEIVVVDDGSRDDTWQMLRRLVTPPGVKLRTIRTKPKGLGAGLNTAVRGAGGKLLLILGDDSFCPPDLITGHLNRHRNLGEPLVAVSGRVVWSPALPASRFRDWLGKGIIHQHPELPQGGFAPNRHFFTLNASINRSLWEKVGGFPEDIPCWIDTVFAYHAANQGMRLYYDPNLVVQHHHDWTEDSFCRRRFKKGQLARQLLRTEPSFDDFVEIPRPTFRRAVLGRLSRLVYPIARGLHLTKVEEWYFAHKVHGNFARGYGEAAGR